MGPGLFEFDGVPCACIWRSSDYDQFFRPKFSSGNEIRLCFQRGPGCVEADRVAGVNCVNYSKDFGA